MQNSTSDPQNFLEEKNSDIVSNTVNALDMVKDNPELLKKQLKYKNVPVYYVPTRAMYRPPAPPGLLQFIEQAMTVQEVNNLLAKGKSDYKNARQKTIRKWELAAERRLQELQNT